MEIRSTGSTVNNQRDTRSILCSFFASLKTHLIFRNVSHGRMGRLTMPKSNTREMSQTKTVNPWSTTDKANQPEMLEANQARSLDISSIHGIVTLEHETSVILEAHFTLPRPFSEKPNRKQISIFS